jgi:signal transduction histidine kinase
MPNGDLEDGHGPEHYKLIEQSKLIEDLREQIGKLEVQIEVFAHNIQVNIQGILSDAEVLQLALEKGRHELAQKDAEDLVQKVVFLLLTSNNIRPNLGDYEYRRTSVKQIVETGIDSFSSLAAERGITVSFVCLFEDGPFAEISRNHFQQAFYNILHNAIKYSYSRQNRPRTVDILLRPHNREYFVLKITNYGVPIDPDEVTRLAANGYRGRHSQQRFRTGSGRGLFIASSVIDQHLGRLLIEPKKVRGGACVTTVSIFMPYRQERGANDEKNNVA